MDSADDYRESSPKDHQVQNYRTCEPRSVGGSYKMGTTGRDR